MNEQGLLLCTDMDRTVIPNGAQPEDPCARPLFRTFCNRPDIQLVYVTGRHQQLVIEAINEYQLPEPDYVITDVGTTIYKVDGPDWHVFNDWHDHIAPYWGNKDHAYLVHKLDQIAGITLQETEKQARFKLSYYVQLSSDHAEIMLRIKEILQQDNILASLIWSIDDQAEIGLLDVLPEKATKYHAIRYLQQKLGQTINNTIFAGDSGNDLPVICSPVHSVLVANASAEVKQQAKQLIHDHGFADAFYLANGASIGMNGNYTAGVLEGVWHFCPEMRNFLVESNVHCNG